LFLQNNAAPHKVAFSQQKLVDLHSEVLKHPAYSPHFAPSDYCRFLNLKKHLKGRKFSSTEKAILAAGRWLQHNQKNFSLMG
jgi:hypothetical protein